MKQEIITLRVTENDLQRGLLEAAQLAPFAITIKKDLSLNAPGHCPKCNLRFEVLDDIHMHHYFDRALKIWVTRWTTTEHEYCSICEVTGNQSVDVFDTPRYVQDVEKWIRKRFEKHRQSTGKQKNKKRR